MRIVPMLNYQNYEGNHSYDIYSLLLKERIIMLTGEINEELSEMIIAELLYLNAADQETPISLYINSPGGQVSAGLAIYDVMQTIKCPVRTIGLGLCASMGAFLLAAGTKGYRQAYKNTEIMIHQPLGESQGQVSDLEIMTKRFLFLKKKLNHILSIQTGKDIKTIELDTDRNHFLTADEAKSYGLIDEITNL